jgi:ADP-heptose:LPS heptosyltransferase
MADSLANLREVTRSTRKIIVVDLGFLGDSVHLVPALWEIKRHYPEAELHTLSAPIGGEVLRLVPCVDRPWAFPLGSPSPPWWRHWDLILALRRERFDLAFNFSGADRTVFLTALTGARWRVAHAAARQHFWGRWLVPIWVSRRSTELPVYEQRRQVLAACGMDLVEPRWDLRVPENASRRAQELAPAGAIHFSVNASTPLKEWPLPNWVGLAKRLLGADKTVRIVATASSSVREQERLRALAEGVSDKRLIRSPGLEIALLAGVLQRCRLHIGADSGVLHLAMALGVPTIALFREYAGTQEWLPRGPWHGHLLARCPCANTKNPPCAGKGVAECLSQISPGQVKTLIDELSHTAGRVPG